MKNKNFTRNFSIIAHIDHGKSTLADRFIQRSKLFKDRKSSEQMLDSMDLERERGITIKAQTASIIYKSNDGNDYTLNLIDTPGHVDFSYEVSRSLSACEGALLVVDASQGVEAQTVANCYKAIDLNLDVIPVLNKIDLPSSDPSRVENEIEEIIGIDAKSAFQVSAKSDIGIDDLIENIIKSIPPPSGDNNQPLKALVIDSWFDNYVGVVMLVRVFDGTINLKEKIVMMSIGESFVVDQLGVFTPKAENLKSIESGQVGFIVTGMKDITNAKVGDTITKFNNPSKIPLEGFKESKPQVYASIYPVDGSDYEMLRQSIEKLKLNDASLFFEPDVSSALGFGFRCGFLGLLHMDIIQERIDREYGVDLIVSAPNVIYKIRMKNGELVDLENPSKLPDSSKIDAFLEPIVDATILLPHQYVGPVITLCTKKRGVQKNISYSAQQVILTYELPLNEIVLDFFDKLKSVSKGYASFDYDFKEFRVSDLVKVDVLINKERVDAMSLITHRSDSVSKGKSLISKIKELIPRQLFDVAVQASIGSNIIARENVKALRKNVTAKCYGGDITRKKKLLERQKEGKKKMRQIGNIEIPKEAFLAVLTMEK